jgi:ABC-type multidrug transport system fused ATPase/permease subunit
MRRFLNILKRLSPYKLLLGLSIFFNILMAIFTIAGIPLFIPFFELIFQSDSAVQAGEPSGIKADLVRIFGDLIIDQDPQVSLRYIILLILVVFILKNIFRYLALFFIAPVRNGFLRDLRQDLYDHLISLPLQFYKQNKKGDLLSRMSMDIQETENSILNILETLIKSPLLILGSLAFMFYVSYELTLLVLILIPFTVIVIGGLSRTLKRQSNIAQDLLGRLMTRLEETMSGNKVIKSFNAGKLFKQGFHTTNQRHYHVLTRLLWRKELGSPLAEVLAVGVIATLMYYAAELVFADKLSPDTFFAFIYAFFIIIEPAKSFSSAYYSYKKGDAALERLEAIFNIQNDILEADDPEPLSHFEHDIKFDEVSFVYPDDPSTPVLKKLSFEVKKGEKIAIVGSSGSGKTTLVDLLPRFMDPVKGKISIDDIPIQKISLHALRNLVGIVTQDPILFNDTVYNNIAFGSAAEKDEKKVREAARIANIDAFIESLPDGYDTLVGEQGSKLSGGQKQRISIARAVLKDAPILILDEATSSLDSASEKKVQQALKSLMKNKTALIIAHRLSTIQDVDKIIVLKAGEIIEVGNHHELMDKKGEYFTFVQLQSLKKDWNELDS